MLSRLNLTFVRWVHPGLCTHCSASIQSNNISNVLVMNGDSMISRCQMSSNCKSCSYKMFSSSWIQWISLTPTSSLLSQCWQATIVQEIILYIIFFNSFHQLFKFIAANQYFVHCLHWNSVHRETLDMLHCCSDIDLAYLCDRVRRQADSTSISSLHRMRRAFNVESANSVTNLITAVAHCRSRLTRSIESYVSSLLFYPVTYLLCLEFVSIVCYRDFIQILAS